ncbi:MAG: chromosome segregation protein SMC [Candidatus Syntrophonatronum acetioxidans]|uniref:Chromosome partition protein Smc n=1 Tax=Candidatus Syntrophonatronum acetioxidans TaxID=1795816 RepID=A0A424YBQ7_9FIRM|nr:MAG: chromosome segregation protein SMC [Candidatus Syntrophonatronum acetioxidans]
MWLFLKKIELFGFKSFSEKAEIELSPGITAIIGPNGCGKSNIADGVKWALGEQSTKNLRGSSMEDVIFNGTDQCKPLSFAEVSLVFDNIQRGVNLDYAEVSITRRLFRSGESQYYINKAPCRLKEITELFHDTGIGKEAYSIISQGKIDQVLSARPEDRRSIFEEAAGIYKYKNRKKEAERRLKETADNLHRVSDLIEELNQQLPSIRRQAEEAKGYISCCDRLKSLETGILVNDIDKKSLQTDKLQKKLEDITMESHDKVNTLNRLESEVTRDNFKVDTLEEKILVEKEKLERIKEEKRSSQGIIQLNQEKLKNLTSQKEEIKENNRELIEKLKFLEKRYSSLLREKDQLQDLINDKKEDLKDKNLRLKEISESISAHQDEGEKKFENVCRKIEEKQLSLKKLELEEGHLNQKRNDIENHLKENKGQLNKLIHKEEILFKELKFMEDSLKEYQQQISDRKELYSSKEEKLEKLKEKIQDKEGNLEKVKMQADVLRDMERRREGFTGAVKAILEAKEKNFPSSQGVEGVVADLLQVSPQYEKAIETALGFAAQQVVTRDENTAKKMISYLKRYKRGRATFLPLSLIDVTSPQKFNLEDKGIVGWAIDLVSFDSRYYKVFKKLLGRVLVVKDLDSAVRLARSLNLKCKVVTLEGEVIFPGGAITGGTSSRTKQSFIGRKNALEKLQEEIKQLEKELNLFQKEREEIKGDLEEAEREMKSFIFEKENKEQDMLKKKNNVNQVIEEKKFLVSHLEELAAENKGLDLKIKDITGNMAALKEEVKELEGEKKKAREFLEEERSRMKNVYGEKSSLGKEIARLEAELSSSEKELKSVHENLAVIKEEKNKLDMKKSELQEKDFKVKAESQEKEEEYNYATKRIRELEKNEDILMEKLKELKKNKDDLLHQLTEREQQIKNLRKNIQTREKKKHDAELEIARLETELKNLVQRLEEEYGIKLRDAYNYALDIGEDKARQEIKTLRERIQEFGRVNTGAIEEYERLKERVDFLKEQREDLRRAKNTIHQVIDEIDEKIKVNFLKSFNQIKASFSAVFRDFFEGGRAYLKLNDPNNILETGIDIIAQPPGKKLQGLSLLSGGEKALTAIALLFAILKVKPTPFCILDEIEVSLDSLNLNRFINYLKSLSEDTQFIVITHRRKTMEAADVLYGVTMEDPGVSKILSMKLPSSKEQRVS